MKRQFFLLISLFSSFTLLAQKPLTTENKSFNGLQYIIHKGEYRNCFFAEERKKRYSDTPNTEMFWSDTVCSDLFFEGMRLKDTTKKLDEFLKVFSYSLGDGEIQSYSDLCALIDTSAKESILNLSMTTEPLYQFADILCIQKGMSEYAGGAHPNHAIFEVNWDIKSDEVVTLSDLFLPGYERKIQPYLQKQLFSKYNEDFSDYYGDTIAISNHFSFTDSGISFDYSPYELLPYAFGMVNLEIPYTDLTDWAKPYFKKQIKKHQRFLKRKRRSAKK